jgi:anti-anti-sigma factor
MREFVLTSTDRDGVVILALEGALRLGVVDQESRRSLSDIITQLARTGTQRVALDLRGLIHTPDSSGLGELMAAQVALARQGGRFAIVNPPAKLRRLIEMMRLEDVLPTYDTEEEVLRAWERPTPPAE